MSMEQLQEQVEAACMGDAPYDETRSRVDARIASEPSNSGLLRLRIRLCEAAYDQATAWKDKQTLAALHPEDFDIQLEALRHQHCYAGLISDDAFSDELRELAPAEDEEEAACGADKPAAETEEERARREAREAASEALQVKIDAHADSLRSQAESGLLALMKRHHDDLDRARRILDAWQELSVWNPWRHYELILRARASHAGDGGFIKAEARYLASLAGAVERESEKAPTGYFDHPLFGRHHAATAYQALEAIGKVADLNHDRDLLNSKGNLHAALDQYPEAAEAFRRSADLLERETAGQSGYELEFSQRELRRLRGEAEAFAAGRDQVYAQHFNFLTSLISDAEAKAARHPSILGTPELSGVKQSLAEWQDAVTAIPTAPTEEEKNNLDGSAQRIADVTVGLVKRDWISLDRQDKEDFQNEPNPWFQEVGTALIRTDLQLQGWFQNRNSVVALKTEAPGQLWLSPDHRMALTVEATTRITLRRCFTLFSDDSIMLTADGRGTGYYLSGPRVATFAVYRSTPVIELIDLHNARVAAHLGANPGLAIVPIDSLRAMEGCENMMNTHKCDFRLKHGITDPEIRGMNVQHNEYFAAQLKRAVAERLKALAP